MSSRKTISILACGTQAETELRPSNLNVSHLLFSAKRPVDGNHGDDGDDADDGRWSKTMVTMTLVFDDDGDRRCSTTHDVVTSGRALDLLTPACSKLKVQVPPPKALETTLVRRGMPRIDLSWTKRGH